MGIFDRFMPALILAGFASGVPVLESRDGVDNTQPYGKNLIANFSSEFLGFQQSDNSCNHRDLGFAGHIQGRWFAVYGDNIYCAQGVKNTFQDDEKHPSGFVRDSVAALTLDPLIVHDLNLNSDTPVGHPYQLTPWIAGWGEKSNTGFGGTSIVETDYAGGTGAVYYLINEDEDYAHAGIGRIQLQADGSVRMAQRYGDQGWWWDTNKSAKYGDIAAYRDERSDYIYVWGHPPQGAKFPASENVYQARVLAQDAFDLSKYEYWWGREQGWKSELLDTFTLETAVMWGTGQGSMFYSNFYNCYVYVHTSLLGGAVLLRTAPAPEGPWSEDVQVYQATPADGGYVYAGIVYPYLDPSSKTVVIAYTNHNNIEVIKVTFK